MSHMRTLIVILNILLDVSRQEGVLIVQVLMTCVAVLVLIVLFNYWLFLLIPHVCKHCKIVRICAARMTITASHIDR
jgi:hypothetical protein